MKIDLRDKIDILLMDFDGVILDSNEVKTAAYREIASRFGKEVEEQFITMHHEYSGISRYFKFRYLYEKILGRSITEEEVIRLAEEFSELAFEKVLQAPFLPGVVALLEQVYLKIPVYVISGTPEPELLQVVKARKLEKYFKRVFGSPVEKPEHIRNILTRERVAPERACFIGDGMTDCRSAAETGVPFIGVKNNLNSKDFAVLPGQQLIQDFTELVIG